MHWPGQENNASHKQQDSKIAVVATGVWAFANHFGEWNFRHFSGKKPQIIMNTVDREIASIDFSVTCSWAC